MSPERTKELTKEEKEIMGQEEETVRRGGEWAGGNKERKKKRPKGERGAAGPWSHLCPWFAENIPKGVMFLLLINSLINWPLVGLLLGAVECLLTGSS